MNTERTLQDLLDRIPEIHPFAWKTYADAYASETVDMALLSMPNDMRRWMLGELGLHDVSVSLDRAFEYATAVCDGIMRPAATRYIDNVSVATSEYNKTMDALKDTYDKAVGAAEERYRSIVDPASALFLRAHPSMPKYRYNEIVCEAQTAYNRETQEALNAFRAAAAPISAHYSAEIHSIENVYAFARRAACSTSDSIVEGEVSGALRRIEEKFSE